MSFSKFVQPATERTYKILLEIDDKRGQPALIVRFAGPGNDDFVNAMYKRAPVPGKASAARDRLDRELDAAVYGETVALGWEHIYDDSGIAAEFTPANATEFLLALARHRPAQFDRIRNLCRAEILFREPSVSADDLGKE